VKMNQPLSGSAMFQVYNTSGTLLAEVGVASASPMKQFNLIADSISFFDTGIALANPNEQNQDAYVSATLLDKSGTKVASTSFLLGVNKHRALFLTELFPKAGNIDEFEGTIQFGTSIAVVPLSLRAAGEKLTSVPTLLPVRGFVPQSTFDPVQSLSGTAPGFRWRIHQNWSDLTLNTLKLTAPSLGLQVTGLQPGGDLGYGLFLMDAGGSSGGVTRLFVTRVSDGNVEFASDSAGLMLGSAGDQMQLTGKMQGSPSGGLTMELTSKSLRRGGWNGGVGVDMDLFLRNGLIAVPAGAGTVTLTTECTSASAKPEEDGVPMLIRITQPVTFGPPDPMRSNAIGILPMLPGPGTAFTLTGNNFGSRPMLVLTASSGAQSTQEAAVVDANTLSATMPAGFADGTIQVDNGQGAGNSLVLKSFFSPSLELKQLAAGDQTAIGFTLDQGPGQLTVNDYRIELYNADRELAGVSGVVGSYKVTGGSGPKDVTNYELRAESSAADKLVLLVIEKGYSIPYARLTVQKIKTKVAGLTFTLTPGSTLDTPSAFAYPVKAETQLTGLPIKFFVVNDRNVFWRADVHSTPSGLTGANTRLTVRLP
jgi:hypothetical protein